MKHSYFFLVISLTAISYPVHSQVIPSDRSTDWTVAGYHGTFPVYDSVKNITDFGGSGDGIVVNDMAFKNAVASLNSGNGVIFFPAGTFLFNNSIILRSGLVLRGEGAANTTLQFNLGGVNDLISAQGIKTTVVANIATSVFKDQSSLTVSDPALFKAGDYIKIYQNDALLMTDTGTESVGQVVRIESISGNVIAFSNALRRNYLLNDTPRIRRLDVVSNIGVECLKIKRLDATPLKKSNIYFSNAAKCWIKGVESDSCNFAHVRIDYSTNIEITNCYFHGAFSYGATGEGYGIACEYASGECLVENNIFRHLRHSMLLQSGANGNVFAYNYSLAPFKSESLPNDLSGDIVLHGNYPYLNLFEGNIVQNIVIDASHGKNGPYNTLFRNRAESYGILISSGAGDSANIIGNEITGTGFGKGNYLMQGNGNLEYGNNKNNTIIPAGTTILSDKSYFYPGMPAFWNIPFPWPPLGIPSTLNSATIPAKERYVRGTELAYCLTPIPVIYTFNGDGNWDLASNWAGNKIPPAILSNESEIIIDPRADGRCVLNVPVTINPGVKITVATGKSFVVQGNLTIAQ